MEDGEQPIAVRSASLCYSPELDASGESLADLLSADSASADLNMARLNLNSSTAVDTLGSTSMKPRHGCRPNCGNRSDGCSEGSSVVPGGPPVALPAEFNLDSRGIPSYDADEVSSADSKADSPRNPVPLQDAGTASCWADLPDGLLREAISHMTPAYLRVMRLVCRGWAEFVGRHTSVLKPEALEGMRLSQRFPHLRVLDLSHCQHMIIHPKRVELQMQSSVTDASLAYLAPLSALRMLSLKGCTNISGPGLSAITGLAHLRALDCTGCTRLTNKGLEHVALLTALTGLTLRECRLVTNDGLRRLEPLAALKALSLSGCTSVSDRGLQSLAQLTALEHISISCCNYVTDQGFAMLLMSPLPHLKRIVVRRCPGVSEDGLRAAAAAKAAQDGRQLELPPEPPVVRRPLGPGHHGSLQAWLYQQGFGHVQAAGQLAQHHHQQHLHHLAALQHHHLHPPQHLPAHPAPPPTPAAVQGGEPPPQNAAAPAPAVSAPYMSN